jgi:hypothetical protein
MQGHIKPQQETNNVHQASSALATKKGGSK